MGGKRASKSGRIRVLAADDHSLVLKGIKAQLRSAPDVVVVGLANSGAQALEIALKVRPNVILMDCDMPGTMSSVEAVRQILKVLKDVRIIGVCDHPLGGKAIKRMFECGASGVIEKTTLCEELLIAVRTVYSGHAYLGRSLADVAVTSFICPKPHSLSSDMEGLTHLESQVLRMTRSNRSCIQA